MGNVWALGFKSQGWCVLVIMVLPCGFSCFKPFLLNEMRTVAWSEKRRVKNDGGAGCIRYVTWKMSLGWTDLCCGKEMARGRLGCAKEDVEPDAQTAHWIPD